MNFARKTECATLTQEQNQTFHAEATVYDLAAWASNQPFHSLQCSLVFCFRVSHCANASSGVTPGFLNSKKAAKSIGTAFHFRATLCLATKDSRNRQISNLDQRPFRSLCRLAYVWPSNRLHQLKFILARLLPGIDLFLRASTLLAVLVRKCIEGTFVFRTKPYSQA